MIPILARLEVFGRHIYLGSYGLALALAIGTASTLFILRARRQGFEAGNLIALCALTIGSGFTGAMILSTAVAAANPTLQSLTNDIPQRPGPGLVFFGALLSGGAVFLLATRILGLHQEKNDTRRLADLAAIPLCIGHSIGRIGCFLGGCCFGKVSPGVWAIRHPSDPSRPLSLAAMEPSMHRHPTALYAAVGLLVIALSIRAVKPGNGNRALAYLLLYSILRFALEFLRGDAERGLWRHPCLSIPLSTSQIIATGTLALGIVLLLLARKHEKAPEV